MVTERGEEHGLINTLGNSVQDNGFKNFAPEDKAKAEKLRKEESRKVKARYFNKKGPHERLTKPYMHWAGDRIEIWHFIPGYVYEVPIGLVNEVNDPDKKPKNRGQLVAKIAKDGSQLPIDGVEEADHQFVPVSF